MEKSIRLEIQRGFQEKVHKCKADIAILGGAMGAGKSYALILEVMKHIGDPYFRCGIFRKSRANLLCPGGLWEEMLEVADYCRLKVKTNRHELKITYPSGAVVQFGHANHPNFKQYLKGTQYSAIFIDEGDEFDEEIFKFLIARLRSKAQVKPYMRITTNPSEGWIKRMIKPYLNEEDYPIAKECGKVKYLYFINNEPVLKNNKEDFIKDHGIPQEDMKYIRTFTFIAGRVDENKKLLENNPEYIANLKTLSDHERDRYLYGWWGELPRNGMFKEGDFSIYSGFPANPDRCVIVCDTAIKSDSLNDYTVATCWAYKKNKMYLIDMLRGKWPYAAMKERVQSFIEDNPYIDTCYIEDYHTGSVLLDDLRGTLRGIRFRPIHREVRASKLRRAQEALAFLNHVKVFLPFDSEKIRKAFLKEICSFSGDMTHAYDDICDTFFDAITFLGKAVRKRPKPPPEAKPLSQTIETIGSFSRVSI
jgi:predicted phage terminase large subunit-like protein